MRLVTVLLGAALAVSLAASTPAQAAPAAPAPPSSSTIDTASAAKPKPVKHTVKINDARHNDFLLAQKVMKTAEDSKGRVNWAKAKKIFGKHRTLRDGYGAGVLMFSRNLNSNKVNWSRFTHISKGDKTRIVIYLIRVGLYPPTSTKSSAASRGSAVLAPIKCKGRTHYDRDGDKNWSYIMYLDSCDTIRLIGVVGLCMPAAGMVGAIAAAAKAIGVSVAMSILSMGCAGAAAWLVIAQQLSDSHSIKIQAGKTSWNKYQHVWGSPVKIVPQ